MIDKLITSKTRLKLLKLFLTNIDNRYYLRELERMLNESLSPLRRQLLKLTNMGILTTEQEANLKYYRLNKNFTGIEELKKLVLEEEQVVEEPMPKPQLQIEQIETHPEVVQGPALNSKRYDALALAVISVFILLAAVVVSYMSAKNVKQIASLFFAQPKTMTSEKMPDEMASRRWKILPGHVPVFSTGTVETEKRSEEL